MFPTYVQPPLEFNLVDSLGLPCRAKLWPSKRPCETFILFLPGQFPTTLLTTGNPGVISYYDEFLTALHHDSTSTTVLGISHVGHEDFYVSEPLSLQEQVDHKLRIVDSILSSFSSFTKDKPRFILMGHSVGAYMALQVLKQRPQNIDNLFLLFPTISDIYKGSMSAKLVAILTSIPYIAMIVAWHIFLIRLVVPIPLIALYLRLAHTLPGRSLSTTLAKFLNPATVQSFIHLGKCELQEIRTLDDDTLTKYASRITAYYALQDKWVPHDQRKLIMRILNDKGGDAFICNEGFPHAFSLGTPLPRYFG